MESRVRRILDRMNDSEMKKILREAVFSGPVKIRGQKITLEDLKTWLKT